MPSYDASEAIRLERQAASQARIEAIKATEKMKSAQAEAKVAKRRQDDAERLLKELQEANERLKSDIRNATMIAETIKGGTEEQSKLLSSLESQVRRAEADSSKGRIENLELRQKLARVEENEAALNKEIAELKTQLDAELKKSIVQKIFETK
jgi:chromosome segregation ATPase